MIRQQFPAVTNRGIRIDEWLSIASSATRLVVNIVHPQSFIQATLFVVYPRGILAGRWQMRHRPSHGGCANIVAEID